MHDEVVKDLIEYIATAILDGREDELDGQTPLLKWGILNSIEIQNLVAHIERRFAVRIPEKLISADNLKDIDTIAAMVARLAG